MDVARFLVGNLRQVLFKQGMSRYDLSVFACKILLHVMADVVPFTFTINTVPGEKACHIGSVTCSSNCFSSMPIDCKSVTTPVTSSWHSLRLHHLHDPRILIQYTPFDSRISFVQRVLMK